MIVTFTANPSLDRTAMLETPLVRGGVHRVRSVTVEPGGKGVNVARCIFAAGHEVMTVLPVGPRDPLVTALKGVGLPKKTVDIDDHVRMNTTLTEDDGTTTKINEPGPSLTELHLAELAAVLVSQARKASWVVLSGSLPPGAPTDWYATLVRMLRPLGCKLAVDTSDRPLEALAAAFPLSAPDLLKPNAAELAQLTGRNAEELEAFAKDGNPLPTVEAARVLVSRGVTTVLATLGSAGAVLVTADGAWHATPPPIVPRSTVGAGDSSLAGYLVAETSGASAPECLRMAVAYGSAAASLAGTALPKPDQVHPDQVVITTLT